MFHSLAQGAMSEGGFSSNWQNKSSTVIFSTGAAFSSLLFGFCGFFFRRMEFDRFLESDSYKRLWKS